MKDRVLLIEDDDAMRASLTQSLELEDISVVQANGLAQARRALRANFPGVVLSDIRMPNADGFDVLKRVQEVDSDLPVIFLTGEADVPMAVRALQSGVYDFLEKPCSVEKLVRVVRRALVHRTLVLQTRRLEATLEHSDAAAVHFPGSTTASVQLRKDLRQLAALTVDVHLHGETGAGRRLAAHTLHFLSGDERAALSVNFARQTKDIVLPDAAALNGRTLILKNIEEADEETCADVSAILTAAADTRVFSTANCALDDLPFWASVLGETAAIRVPSLRARLADLPLIFENLVRQAARNIDADMPDIPPEMIQRLTARDWRGNLPELRTAAQKLVLGTSDDTHTPTGLTDQVMEFERSVLLAALQLHDGVAVKTAEYLKLPRKTLYDKLARHGIEPKAVKSQSESD